MGVHLRYSSVLAVSRCLQLRSCRRVHPPLASRAFLYLGGVTLSTSSLLSCRRLHLPLVSCETDRDPCHWRIHLNGTRPWMQYGESLPWNAGFSSKRVLITAVVKCRKKPSWINRRRGLVVPHISISALPSCRRFDQPLANCHIGSGS